MSSVCLGGGHTCGTGSEQGLFPALQLLLVQSEAAEGDEGEDEEQLSLLNQELRSQTAQVRTETLMKTRPCDAS